MATIFGVDTRKVTQPAQTALALPKAEALPVAASAGAAFLGYKTWKKHKWFGAIVGLPLGNAAVTLLRSPVKADALTPLGAAAGAVAGVRFVPRKYAVVGFVVGLLGGGVAGNFVSKKV